MRASPVVLGRIASTPSAPTPKWRSQISRTTAGSWTASGRRRAAGWPGRRSTTTKSFPSPLGLDERKRHGAARVVYCGRAGAGAARPASRPASAPSAGCRRRACACAPARACRSPPRVGRRPALAGLAFGLGVGLGGLAAGLGLGLGRGRGAAGSLARARRAGVPAAAPPAVFWTRLARLLESAFSLSARSSSAFFSRRLALGQLLQALRVLLAGEVRQPQRREQEDDRGDRRQPRQEVARARRAEDRLAAAAAAERDAHAAALAGLQQHDEDQEEADDDVNDGEERDHDVGALLYFTISNERHPAVSDAPPTSAPSMSGWAMSARRCRA